MRIQFHSRIEQGFDFSIKGQRYVFMGTQPHTLADGSETSLMVWQTECAECGARMDAKSPIGFGPEARRCKDHANPGVPVKSKPCSNRPSLAR